MCCYNHDGHIAINQRDRSVLHLSGRITLGMDIRYFLQFQCAFQSHGIGEATTEIKEVMRVSKGTCEVTNLVVGLQHLADDIGNVVQFANHLQIFLTVDGALGLTHSQCNHGEHGDLPREGLRRSDTNLRTYMDVGTGIGGTRNG